MSLSDIWFGVAAMLQLPPEVGRPKLQIYNPDTFTAVTLFEEQASSLLTTGRALSVLAGDWLQDVSGELVTTVDGDTISCAMPVVLQIPEFVLTNNGDVIGTGGE